MPTITKAKALEILRSKPSTLVSFETETPANLFNKGGTKGTEAMIDSVNIDSTRIVKHTTFVGLIGTKIDYGTLVENRLAKEADLKGTETPDFTAKPRKWGTRVDGVLVEHTDKKGVEKQYVTIHCIANNIPQVRYSYKGAEFDHKDSKYDTWRKKKSAPPKTQLEAGIENPVTYRDYDLSSIVSIKVGGETYNINH
jgi:hypothetical protein